MTKETQKLNTGKDSVVIGNKVEGEIGDGSIVIGAMDDKGNIILNQPMAVGRDACTNSNSIAIGAGANAGTSESNLAESDNLFQEIDLILSQSSLSIDHQKIISYDLKESQKSYQNEAYKSCVVMLGAALEGFMLGALQRSDVIEFFKTNNAKTPEKIKKLGTQNPTLYIKIGSDLGFEDYKVSLNQLIDGIEDLGVDNIQSFRNAIHPWKCIQNREKYGSFDKARALHYIGSFQKIIQSITNWKP